MIRILLLGVVLAGVYYLYRMVTQQGAAPPAGPAREAGSEHEAGPAPRPEPAAIEAEVAAPPGSEQAAALGEAAAAEAQEMIECPLCQAYVPETAHEGCGRPDCPVPTLAASREDPPG